MSARQMSGSRGCAIIDNARSASGEGDGQGFGDSATAKGVPLACGCLLLFLEDLLAHCGDQRYKSGRHVPGHHITLVRWELALKEEVLKQGSQDCF